jgi:hypothetical protein
MPGYSYQLFVVTFINKYKSTATPGETFNEYPASAIPIGCAPHQNAIRGMKIITWNCNMAFRKKADFIPTYKPDILIVPECENLDKLTFDPNKPKPTDLLWFGTNENKGLGIFSYCHFKVKLLKNHNRELKMIIPISVTGGQLDFTLYAIWANNPDDPNGQYG